MDFNRGAVQGYGFNLHAHELSMLQTLKDSIQNTRLRPAAHARIDRVPASKALGQGTPLAPLLGNVEDRVEDLKVREADIAALTRQAVFDEMILSFGEFHAKSISHRGASVNRP